MQGLCIESTKRDDPRLFIRQSPEQCPKLEQNLPAKGHALGHGNIDFGLGGLDSRPALDEPSKRHAQAQPPLDARSIPCLRPAVADRALKGWVGCRACNPRGSAGCVGLELAGCEPRVLVDKPNDVRPGHPDDRHRDSVIL